VRDVARDKDFAVIPSSTWTGTHPTDNLKELAKIEVCLGMSIPEEYGVNLPVFDTALVLRRSRRTATPRRWA
jgi:hypothetical protein